MGERMSGRNGYESHHQTRWQEVLVGDPHDHRGLVGDTKDGGTTDQDGIEMDAAKWTDGTRMDSGNNRTRRCNETSAEPLRVERGSRMPVQSNEGINQP